MSNQSSIIWALSLSGVVAGALILLGIRTTGRSLETTAATS